MKNYKRIMCVALAVTLALSMGACGKNIWEGICDE